MLDPAVTSLTMGKTLIIYATRNGTTARAAGILAERLAGEVELAEIGKSAEPDIASFDTVLVGGSIRAGRLHKDVRKLCEKHAASLLE
jgi:menaquinone-dependent protoporphyrinogen oxidase